MALDSMLADHDVTPGVLARQIVEILVDHKASDVLLLDIHRQSIIADFFVICTGNGDRQVRALTDHVLAATALLGEKPLHLEGQQEGAWVVIDYGAVIVHLFAPPDRDYYRLEDVWADSATVARVL